MRKSQISYAGLGGYEKLLDNNSRDVDLVVSPEDLKKCIVCLVDVYREQGWVWTKVIENEYAVQIFFSKYEGGEFRFLQWDLMPCLTWRGLTILEVDPLLKNATIHEGVSIAPASLVAIYKEVRTALCNSTKLVRIDQEVFETLSAEDGVPSWLGKTHGMGGMKLRNLLYLRRVLPDLLRFARFYYLNFRRFLNPPGLIVAIDSGHSEGWDRCMENGGSEEEAFPYTGVMVHPHSRFSWRARLGILKDSYLGRVVVVERLQNAPVQKYFSGSRSLSFLFFGSVDYAPGMGEDEAVPNNQLLTNLVEATIKTFIKK